MLPAGWRLRWQGRSIDCRVPDDFALFDCEPQIRQGRFEVSLLAQVRAFQAALPNGARVGSVDKFQGQEAPVCVLSLCSSYGEYGSRGLKFILDRNRINVAISRAQCLAVVVADPRIASAEADSIEEMMLINLFCKIAGS